MQQKQPKSIKATKREVKKDHVYIITPSVGASMPGIILWSWASMPDVTVTLAPLEPTIDISINEICTAECTIASSTYVRPSYVVSSWRPRCSLSISASDSAAATLLARTSSPVIARGTSKSAGISRISSVPKIIYISVDFSWSTSFLNSAIAAFKAVTSSMAP
ncbi:hypothetical protein H5410_040557 [Solanum commersonii]|uniref:Uncharacterized protein n=1 Tax=Solanum commersonii TaxID=4109 RepID=A0A9J5XP66_SOLCO|nr:hypothetical protein H5410_040557 [Solanum commersonii]